jgi:hypothetical protein
MTLEDRERMRLHRNDEDPPGDPPQTLKIGWLLLALVLAALIFHFLRS